jgi:hypothetical protein
MDKRKVTIAMRVQFEVWQFAVVLPLEDKMSGRVTLLGVDLPRPRSSLARSQDVA